MRILYFDIDSLGAPYGGGQARRTYEVVRRIAQRHDVTVVTAGHPSLSAGDFGGVRYERMLALPFPANFFWYFGEILPRGLLAKCDLIVESFAVPFTASLLARVSTVPVVGVSNFLFAAEMTKKYRLPLDVVERLMLKPFRYVITLSEAQRAHVAAIAPQARIAVIPNGADERASLFAWNGNGAYIAFMGRIDINQKGLDYLLDAAESMPNAEVRIAGDGPDRERLRAEIDARGLRHRVSLVGTLAGDERHRFLAEAALLAFPSRYEGQSLVLLDALTIGVPIVAFDIAANVEVLAGGGVLVPAFDAHAFSSAVRNLYGDRDRQRETSSALRALSARYRWDAIARSEEQFYGDVLADEAGRRRRTA